MLLLGFLQLMLQVCASAGALLQLNTTAERIYVNSSALTLLTPATFKKRLYFDFLNRRFKLLKISYLFLYTGQLELEVG